MGDGNPTRGSTEAAGLDRPLKELYRRHAAELLALTGDTGAEVVRTDAVELHGLSRRVDGLIELRHPDGEYARHVEFQRRADPDVPRRMLEYGALLNTQRGLPVLSTVIYVEPPAPSYPSHYEVRLHGRTLNRWHFETVCLWEIDVDAAIESGRPGLLALVPMLKGATLASFETAYRTIRETAPDHRVSATESVLLALAWRSYNRADLDRIVGRQRIMQSTYFQDIYTEGKQDTCMKLLAELHPSLLAEAEPVVRACTDLEQLDRWILLVARSSSTDDVARALGLR